MKAFGCEYGYRSDLGRWRRMFVRVFGVVDLHSRIRARAVLWALQDICSDRVLDIGTGTGVYPFYLTRDTKSRVLALDIDASRIAMVRYIADRLSRHNLSTVCDDEHALATMPAEEFSVVLAVEVLQYFPHLSRTLRDLQERLRSGGVLIAHVPVREALLPYEHTLFNDAMLSKLFLEAGFDPPEIRQTCGRFSQALCAVFAWCAPRHVLLAVLYPLLLLATVLTPRFTQNGGYRLVIARKSKKNLVFRPTPRSGGVHTDKELGPGQRELPRLDERTLLHA